MAKNNSWISIKDKLPENPRPVLVCSLQSNGECYYAVGNYVFDKRKNKGWWEVDNWMFADSDGEWINIYFDDTHSEGKITHWKKILPPKK